MTTRRPLLIASALAFAVALMAALALAASVTAAPPVARSCPTPAMNFATLVACEATMTAQALLSAPDATETQRARDIQNSIHYAETIESAMATVEARTRTGTPSATPTKVTPQPSPVPLVVYVKVIMKIGGERVDLGIVELRAGEPVSIELERVDFYPQPTATPTALPETRTP